MDISDEDRINLNKHTYNLRGYLGTLKSLIGLKNSEEYKEIYDAIGCHDWNIVNILVLNLVNLCKLLDGIHYVVMLFTGINSDDYQVDDRQVIDVFKFTWAGGPEASTARVYNIRQEEGKSWCHMVISDCLSIEKIFSEKLLTDRDGMTPYSRFYEMFKKQREKFEETFKLYYSLNYNEQDRFYHECLPIFQTHYISQLSYDVCTRILESLKYMNTNRNVIQLNN